jgi:hypothetical protein
LCPYVIAYFLEINSALTVRTNHLGNILCATLEVLNNWQELNCLLLASGGRFLMQHILYRVNTLALTVSLLSLNAYAVGPANTINNGKVISGGTYYNTADNKTTFTNTQGGGLWVKSGTNVRGLEVDAGGHLTNNGGTLQFYAPGDVVRIDGNIDVNALRNGQGAFVGNGGRVFVDSAYLYQNGNVLANGINGGLVQFNVAGATLNATAQIEAKGMGGNGGVISINASGPVVIAAAILDTSGKVAGTFDSNVINIEGGLVIQEGLLRANGVDPSFNGSRGGTIRLVATGQSGYPTIQDAFNRASQGPDPIFTQTERQNLAADTQGFIQSNDGNVLMNGISPIPGEPKMSASGTRGLVEPNNDYTQDTSPRAGDGGTILVSARNRVDIGTSLSVNGAVGTRNPDGSPVAGGNGGTIALAGGDVVGFSNPSNVQANGGRGGWTTGASQRRAADSGDGGLIASNSKLLSWIGGSSIMANGALGGDGARPGKGGNGGLVVFSADQTEAFGHDNLHTDGGQGGNFTGWALGGKAGTIVTPDPQVPQSVGATQRGALNGQEYSKPISEVTQINELLTHGENLLLFTRNGGAGPVDQNLFTRMLASKYRSVEDPTGSLGLARSEIVTKNTPGSAFAYHNFLVASTRNGQALDLTHPWRRDNDPGATAELLLPSPLSQGQAFTGLNTLTIQNNGSVITSTMENQGPYNAPYPTNFTNWLLGLGRSNLGGTRISVFANGDFRNTNFFGTTGLLSGGSINIAAANTVQNGNFEQGTLGTNLNGNFTGSGSALHGGSLILKAGQDIRANVNGLPTQSSFILTSGRLMGGVQRYSSKRDFRNDANILNGDPTIVSNGGLLGGIIDAKIARDIITRSGIEANGTQPSVGRGGYVRFIAGRSVQGSNEMGQSYFRANGSQSNGTVIVQP